MARCCEKAFKPSQQKYTRDGRPAPNITKLYTEAIPYGASEIVFKSDNLKCEDRYQFSLTSKENREVYKNNVDYHVKKCEKEEIAHVKNLLRRIMLLAANEKTYFATDYNVITFYDNAWLHNVDGPQTYVRLLFLPVQKKIYLLSADETQYHYSQTTELYEAIVEPLTRPFRSVIAEKVVVIDTNGSGLMLLSRQYEDYLYKRPPRLDGRDRLEQMKRAEYFRKFI